MQRLPSMTMSTMLFGTMLLVLMFVSVSSEMSSEMSSHAPLLQVRIAEATEESSEGTKEMVGQSAVDGHKQGPATGSDYFDAIKFIQYLDENTALEEVRNGNLDIYYYKIPSDRLEGIQAREGLQVFDSAGGSYSILANPAESDRFNPFSYREIRFALNYLVDRGLIVNELMGGYGYPITSYYGPSDPEYLTVIEQLEEYGFVYNPALAERIISKAMTDKVGAIKMDGVWHVRGEPVKITIFIRSDDPVRKSIGEILASDLKEMGFVISKDFGDLNKAFVVVYGSDPADMRWNLYTEGWGRSAFVRYDSTGLGQMYAPWFSSMPGFNDPTYWNYQNDLLDELTQRIYTGNFTTQQERASLIREAVKEGVNEAVRVFLASNVDQYVAHEDIEGIVNDLGAGVPSRFTPINAKGQDSELVIGVKQIYQGAWNPVMGLADSYSRHIWGAVADPGVFKHPFTGETFPVRTDWQIHTAGPNDTISLSPEAVTWNPYSQEWDGVPDNATATSRVTFDLVFGRWHNGQMMDINDIMYSLYFVMEWGTRTDESDKTFDTEFTPRAAQSIQSIKGVNIIDEDTIEVYVDYWHFDQGEIAEWASMWSQVPWEITAAMEGAVVDGKVAFSRSGATAKNVNWLSLIVPNDAQIIRQYLQEFKESEYVPVPLQNMPLPPDVDVPPHTDDIQDSVSGGPDNGRYYTDRYDATMDWIDANAHAVISNGPFYLKSYSPEARTITLGAFSHVGMAEDNQDSPMQEWSTDTPDLSGAVGSDGDWDGTTYPFGREMWSGFGSVEFPVITRVDMEDHVQRGEQMQIAVHTDYSNRILYFLAGSDGSIVTSDILDIQRDGDGGVALITMSADATSELGTGASTIKIFAVSDTVLKPDMYVSSFFVADTDAPIQAAAPDTTEPQKDDPTWYMVLIVSGIVVVGMIIYLSKRRK